LFTVVQAFWLIAQCWVRAMNLTCIPRERCGRS